MSKAYGLGEERWELNKVNMFLNFSLRQYVNQWLCVILVSFWCVYMLIVWLNGKAEILEIELSAQRALIENVSAKGFN